MGGILSGLSPGSLKFFISSVRYNEKEYVCNILILFSLSLSLSLTLSLPVMESKYLAASSFLPKR